jgi:flagellar biosynthesis protein FlhG
LRIRDARLNRLSRRLLDRFRSDPRDRMAQLPGAPSIGIASGKGGPGKTFVSVNLACLVARTLAPVQLIDADLGLGNAHLALGARPQHDLQRYFAGDVPLDGLILGTPYGVRLLPGGSGISRLAQLAPDELQRLARDFLDVLAPARVIMLDSAAGIAPQTLAFLTGVDLVVLVVTPELTALTDAYAVVKCLIVRRPQSRFLVLVNRCDEADQGQEVFNRIHDVAGRFLSVPLHYLGWVPEDRTVRRALAAKVPLVEYAPDSPATAALIAAGNELLRVLEPVGRDALREGFAARMLGLM